MESLACPHSFSILKHVLLLINMTRMDESKATDCSLEAEIASLVEVEPRELFISELNWAGNSAAFSLS